jgi:FixJ family two-component response regulator
VRRRHDGLLLPEAEVKLSKAPVISIVDDDASVRAATNNLVRSHGYCAHTFGSADEFLQSAHLNDTSCVITDVQMPAISGIELLLLLRIRGHSVPVIFITAFPTEELRARALKAGAMGFLAKPFDGAVLIDCLETSLKQNAEEIRN